MSILPMFPRREPQVERAPRSKRGGMDELGVARCPKCNMPMALRYTRRGPAFVCQCADKRRAA
jgi:ssDNA-binding Zn-finger/Zn-ribbon topoisomerase 1